MDKIRKEKSQTDDAMDRLRHLYEEYVEQLGVDNSIASDEETKALNVKEFI
jgi:hypothetical protein